MEKYTEKLREVIATTGWSQELLAAKLEVSFVSLNSWINGKSEPRPAAKERIDLIYVEVMGERAISPEELTRVKALATARRYSVKRLLGDRTLLEKVTTSLTYHNNATEGSTMTEQDVAAVVYDNRTLRNRTAVEQREAINHQTALYFLLDELARPDFRFTSELIRAVHLRMMNGIISDAGYWRNHSVRIHGAYVPLTNYLKIPELVDNWCNLVNSETTDKIALLATSHAKFEQIHPFSDGNGRTGRLLLFALALYLGLVPPILKKELHLAYYKYLELAQMREMTDPLEMFIAEAIIATGGLMEAQTGSVV